MTNLDDNLSTLSSCMFSGGVDGSAHAQSCNWREEVPETPQDKTTDSGEGWGPSQEDDWMMEESLSEKEVKRVRKGRLGYKHVPHRDKPPQLVARRNARERRRVQAVNVAFSRLRTVVPIENNRYANCTCM